MCVCLVAVSRREPSLPFIACSLRGNIPFLPCVPKGMIPSTVRRRTCWDAQVCERFSKACIKGNEGEVKQLTNKMFGDRFPNVISENDTLSSLLLSVDISEACVSGIIFCAFCIMHFL